MSACSQQQKGRLLESGVWAHRQHATRESLFILLETHLRRYDLLRLSLHPKITRFVASFILDTHPPTSYYRIRSPVVYYIYLGGTYMSPYK